MSSVQDRAFGGAGGERPHRPVGRAGPQEKPSLAYYVVLIAILALFSYAIIAGEPQSERDRSHFQQEWSSEAPRPGPGIYDGRGKWGGYAD